MKIKQPPTFVLASPEASANLRAQTHTYNGRSSQSFFNTVVAGIVSFAFGTLFNSVAIESQERTAYVMSWTLFILGAALFLGASYSLYARMRMTRAIKTGKVVSYRMTFLHFWRAKLAAYELDYREKESLDWLTINHFNSFEAACRRWSAVHTTDSRDGDDNQPADQILMAELERLVAAFAEKK